MRASALMRRASSQPSMPGMCWSRMASAKGSPLASAAAAGPRAPPPRTRATSQLHARRRELGAQDLAVRGVVVDGEDPHARQARVDVGGSLRRRPAGGSRRSVNQNVEPAVGRALDADVAAHAVHELAADGEAEARAAVLARGRGVDLRERLEELALGLHRRCPTPVSRTSTRT